MLVKGLSSFYAFTFWSLCSFHFSIFINRPESSRPESSRELTPRELTSSRPESSRPENSRPESSRDLTPRELTPQFPLLIHCYNQSLTRFHLCQKVKFSKSSSSSSSVLLNFKVWFEFDFAAQPNKDLWLTVTAKSLRCTPALVFGWIKCRDCNIFTFCWTGTSGVFVDFSAPINLSIVEWMESSCCSSLRPECVGVWAVGRIRLPRLVLSNNPSLAGGTYLNTSL